MASVNYTMIANPFKRFIAGIDFKLGCIKISALEMVPFSTVITRNAVTILRNPSFTGRAEVWHKL